MTPCFPRHLSYLLDCIVVVDVVIARMVVAVPPSSLSSREISRIQNFFKNKIDRVYPHTCQIKLISNKSDISLRTPILLLSILFFCGRVLYESINNFLLVNIYIFCKTVANIYEVQYKFKAQSDKPIHLVKFFLSVIVTQFPLMKNQCYII